MEFVENSFFKNLEINTREDKDKPIKFFYTFRFFKLSLNIYIEN